ncbi:hypothetical protein HMPREF9120_00882 [Neisseria sp. oral taxon 020 str. F0370]|nr:hypothetical protein HMPREF9120_00882 [Neisseria sp. oral taxon 020 str. F0370]
MPPSVKNRFQTASTPFAGILLVRPSETPNPFSDGLPTFPRFI